MNVFSQRLDRRYRVFISSTFDLEEHRRQAVLGIVSAGHMAIPLENYPPEGDTKQKVIFREIESCQFYVIILGSRYGTIPSDHRGGDEKSYVELELDYALLKGLKILAFVIDQSLLTTTEPIPDGKYKVDNAAKYFAFRDRLTDGTGTVFHRPFKEPSAIRENLLAFFSRPHEDVPGYVLELNDADKAIAESVSRNEIVKDVARQLDAFQDIEPRLSIEKDKKKALAEAFVMLHGGHIESGHFSQIFLESGSTITYVAKALSTRLPRTSSGRPAVVTNNAFAYLYLWLAGRVFCHPVPEGPPDEKYGGMYGRLTHVNRQPDYSGMPLSEFHADAPKLIQEVRRDIFGKEVSPRTLLLAASSGLQVSDQVNAIYPRTCPEDPVRSMDNLDIVAEIGRCRGFHGGSYKNKLLKRCLYLAKIPTIVFIHDIKLDCPIEVGKCHFFCDSEYTWNNVMSEHPLSIWVGCNQASYGDVLNKLKSHLTSGNWTFQVEGKSNVYPTVIARNEHFEKEWARLLKSTN